VGRARGEEAFTRQTVSGAAAVYPVVARSGDSTVVAWTRDGTKSSVIQVTRLDD
jgi:hypothetical protein